ncbi:MAG TPA: NUDIX hydrolase [Patescibacteria group bacterium]|nr:NUDIX hydrolase [Patescibacteria group bacterium]
MHIQRPFSKQPIPENAKKVFSGILFDVYQWEQVQFDGSIKTFEKVKRRDTVGILAITPEKKILLLEQEQPGTKPFVGTPGGIIDENEDVFEAAQRELLEETGYASNDWKLFEAVQPLSKIDWALFTFVAQDCKKIQDPSLDSGEKVKPKEVTWNEFLQVLLDDSFRDHELILKSLKTLRQGNGEMLLRKQIFGS